MGSRLFSNTTNLLGGHDFTNAEHREKIADILNIDPTVIPTENSLPYHQIIEGILRGRSKACGSSAPIRLIRGSTRTNATTSRPARLPCRAGHVSHDEDRPHWPILVLPAAGWGEKEGTFINSERRIGLIKKVSNSPQDRRFPTSTSSSSSRTIGAAKRCLPMTTPEDVFEILKQCSAGQPCDISGITDYRQIDSAGGIQWPVPEESGDVEQERRLFTDGRFYHADGRRSFPVRRPAADPRTDDRSLSVHPVDRSRHGLSVAYAIAHRTISRAQSALSRTDLC